MQLVFEMTPCLEEQFVANWHPAELLFLAPEHSKAAAT